MGIHNKIEYVAQKAELRRLIRMVGTHFGASENECTEMFNDTLAQHPDVDKSIRSYRVTVEKYLKRK